MKLGMRTDDDEHVWVVIEDNDFRVEFSGVVSDAELSIELDDGLDSIANIPRLIGSSHVFNLKLVGIKTVTRITVPPKQGVVPDADQ